MGGEQSAKSQDQGPGRRGFLSVFSGLAMLAGLLTGYGALAAHSLRFLFPTKDPTAEAWQFVSTVQRFGNEETLQYTAPSGAQVVIARQGSGNTVDDFVALSSICPHLGCQVHWEANNERFFCPCHNGAFDKAGKPTAGPPVAANQQLTRFPLKVENGLLYILAPLRSVTNPTEA